jgi:hypothetical protein
MHPALCRAPIFTIGLLCRGTRFAWPMPTGLLGPRVRLLVSQAPKGQELARCIRQRGADPPVSRAAFDCACRGNLLQPARRASHARRRPADRFTTNRLRPPVRIRAFFKSAECGSPVWAWGSACCRCACFHVRLLQARGRSSSHSLQRFGAVIPLARGPQIEFWTRRSGASSAA